MRSRQPMWAVGAVGLLAVGWTTCHAASPAVRGWRPGAGRSIAAGPLRARTFGTGDPVVLLLHGMAAGGNSFGAAFDGLGRQATVVVPDLLGFGGSRAATGAITAEKHFDALDEMIDALNLTGRPVVVAGHSMGGALALRWSARHPTTVRTVVTLCAPLYRTRVESDDGMRRIGRMNAFLAGDGPVPGRACAWMCRYRGTASWLSVAARPDLPVPVARSAVQHTWPSYRDSLDELIRDSGWESALRVLEKTTVSVTLAEAAHDPVPVPGRAAHLAAASSTIRHEQHPSANHALPLADGGWCAALISATVRGEGSSHGR